MEQIELAKLRRRFVILGFAKGFMLWYAIDKLLQIRIGITPEQIVLIGILVQGFKLFFELPTSVFADRWNRRKILALAEVSMIVSSIILGLSNSILVFIIGALFWSLYDALSAGVFEAFVYDTIAAAGHKDRFKEIYTRLNSSELLSMSCAGALAGYLTLRFNVRLPFFLTAVVSAICLVLLLQLKEPLRERTTDAHITWVGHLSGAMRIILSPGIRWVAAIYIVLVGFLTAWYEYFQLLGLDIKLTPFLFGSLITVLTFGMFVGSELAHKLPASKPNLIGIWIVVILTHLIGLRFPTIIGVFASLFITFVAFMLLELYLELYLQDSISSERRATVFSLLTTLAYAWFFVVAAVFALLLHSRGIRTTLTIASLPLLVLGVIDIVRRVPWSTGKVSDSPSHEEVI